jgi:hypothetical protein
MGKSLKGVVKTVMLMVDKKSWLGFSTWQVHVQACMGS